MIQKYALTSSKDYGKLARAIKLADTRTRNTIIVLFYTGMHISVYCDPEKHKVVWNGELLRWNRPKKEGSKGLVGMPVPISGFPRLVKESEVRSAITKWLETPDWEAEGRKHKWRIGRFQARLDLERIGKKVGLPNLSPAVFRHTFCFLDLQATNGNMALVKQHMGCSEKMIYNNYALIDWSKG